MFKVMLIVFAIYPHGPSAVPMGYFETKKECKVIGDSILNQAPEHVLFSNYHCADVPPEAINANKNKGHAV